MKLWWLAALAMGTPCGAEVLFDFETEADLAQWTPEGSPAGTASPWVSRAERYATSGRWSLCFAVPKWTAGQAEWPAFECAPPIADWSPFERLVLRATNPSEAPQKLCIFVSDAAHATRDGYALEENLPPLSYRECEIPLAKVAAKGLSLASMRVIHVFTERPPADMALHLDQWTLLREGESLPAPAEGALRELAGLRSRDVADLRGVLERAEASIAETATGEIARWSLGQLAECRDRVDAFARAVAEGDPELALRESPRAAIEAVIERLRTSVALREEFARIAPTVRVAGSEAGDGVVVGFASPMEKVLPRGLALPIRIAHRADVSLARNEREALPVVVLPCERDLRDVSVRVEDLVSPEGAVFPKEQVLACAMGYAQTKSTPPYGSSHIGWWPDPILEHMTDCDVARDDAQSFWVRFHAPGDQPAGRYTGKLTVRIGGQDAFAFDLAVRVRDFALPLHPPLPVAVTWWPMYYHADASGEGEYQDDRWRAHKDEWADMLADHYLGYDSLYEFKTWAPDFETLARQHAEGRLGRFNLGYYTACEGDDAAIEAWTAEVVARVRPRYERAKELGILDHAYIYGADENPPDRFPGVERAAAILKREFPGVFILTTTYDHSFGQESVIRSMDGFCPLTPSFDPALAEKARAEGKQVWWYICCGPHHPYANMFVEYPAIEGRLLMGAMAAKQRPDGFLYYQTSIWNSPPISDGPFTSWDPRSWTTYYGDGSWTCPGPDGRPLPTIRLENFRDGAEDYAYARILEATIAKVEADPSLSASRQEWLRRARSALTVPSTLVKSMTEYSRDPALVEGWRERMASAIESAGTEPADPWGEAN